MLWSAPLQIILAMYMLYQELGESTFVGLSVTIIMLPFNSVLMGKMHGFQVTGHCYDVTLCVVRHVILLRRDTFMTSLGVFITSRDFVIVASRDFVIVASSDFAAVTFDLIHRFHRVV